MRTSTPGTRPNTFFVAAAALALSLTVLPASTPNAVTTATEVSMESVMEAASRAGYFFVPAGTECTVDCDSNKFPCEEGEHQAKPWSDENEVGKGDHTYCQIGSCADHDHIHCDKQLAMTFQLFNALAEEDWTRVSQVIDGSDAVSYNARRHAIQGLDCKGDHLGLHLPMPDGYVAFLDAEALQ